jgi:hypothetical protein
MTDNDRRILEGLERRKAIKEDPCDPCGGSGRMRDGFCRECLGQGVVITAAEYEWLLTFANRADDEILGAEVIGD